MLAEISKKFANVYKNNGQIWYKPHTTKMYFYFRTAYHICEQKLLSEVEVNQHNETSLRTEAIEQSVATDKVSLTAVATRSLR